MSQEIVLRDAKAIREQRKADREARAWEREKLIYDRVLTPNVVRLALAAGIIAYSTHVCRSEKNEGPINSALAFALPGIGIPLLAADAGITDKYALAAMSGAALAWTTGQAGLGLAQAPSVKNMALDVWHALTPWPD